MERICIIPPPHARTWSSADRSGGKAEYDAGWLYRVRPTRGDAPSVARNKEGEYWFWDFEVSPLGHRKR
jgi:hypothetical protein